MPGKRRGRALLCATGHASVWPALLWTLTDLDNTGAENWPLCNAIRHLVVCVAGAATALAQATWCARKEAWQSASLRHWARLGLDCTTLDSYGLRQHWRRELATLQCHKVHHVVTGVCSGRSDSTGAGAMVCQERGVAERFFEPLGTPRSGLHYSGLLRT